MSISALYPAAELSTGTLFAAAPLILGWTSEVIVAWTLVSLMVIIFVSDYKYMIIPNKVLLVFGVILTAERILIPLSPWWDSLAGGILGFLLLLFIAVISKGGMGGGDIKLYSVIGIALGVKLVLLSFFFSHFVWSIFRWHRHAYRSCEKGKTNSIRSFYWFGNNNCLLLWQ